MTVLTIARHTLHEAFSRRLVLAALGLSLIFLALCGLGFLFLYGKLLEGPKSSEREVAVAAAVLTVLGLYAVNFLSSLLALFLAVGAVSAEVESGTLQAVLARPIRRSAFVVGRWLAHALLIALYVTLMTAAPLLLARLIAGYEAPDPLRAGALMLLSALVLLTLSLLGSTRLPTLANGVVGFSLFAVARLAGIIEYVGQALNNTAMTQLSVAVSLVVPSDGLWQAASYYVQSPALLAFTSAVPMGLPFASNLPPAAPFVVWSLLHPLAALLLAVWAFQRRDL